MTMLIKKLLEDDTLNCYQAVSQDKELSRLDSAFYEIVDRLPKGDKLKLEEIFTRFTARLTRIVYLQGMKDFAELHIVLKEDTAEILQKYIDQG